MPVRPLSTLPPAIGGPDQSPDGSSPQPSLDLFIPVRQEPERQLAAAVRAAQALARSPELGVYILCGADDDATLAHLTRLTADADGVRLRVVPSCAPKARAMNEAVRTSDAPWIGFLDVDVAVAARDLVRATVEADRAGLDYVEFVELSAGTGRMTRLLNVQSELFQMANAYLAERLRGRYFASSGLLLRRSFALRVGPWPEDGCEEGYRWSLTAAGVPQRGWIHPVPARGRPAADLYQALRQRRRWYQGQLRAAVDCLRLGYPARGRVLGLLGGASLLAQAAWTISAALSPVSARARRVAGVLTALEATRLAFAAPSLASAAGRRARDLVVFLAFELVEGLAVLSAMVPDVRRAGWRPTVRG